jgi:hypothetical protein
VTVIVGEEKKVSTYIVDYIPYIMANSYSFRKNIIHAYYMTTSSWGRHISA